MNAYEDGYVEVAHAQRRKHGQKACGDVFLSSRETEAGRIVCSMSDGLGSGVKANVLANMTATMAERFALSRFDPRRAAETIMATLPVCAERRISYATFSLVDVRPDGWVRLVEYDNPGFLLFRRGEPRTVDTKRIPLPERFPGRRESLTYAEFPLEVGDRLVLMTDGVTQSGMGRSGLPLGWRTRGVQGFVRGRIEAEPEVSAQTLSVEVTRAALRNDELTPKDDITCAVVFRRMPRRLLLVTGPPVDRARNPYLAGRVADFEGRTVVSGGTTAQIVSEHLGRKLRMDLRDRDPRIPPRSSMEGVDLVTEGILTLSCVADLLEARAGAEGLPRNAAGALTGLLLESDSISFLMGTRINEAHQDPNMPLDLGIRRTIVRRIMRALEESYLKKVDLELV